MKNITRKLKTLIFLAFLVVITLFGMKGYGYLVNLNRQHNLTQTDRNDLFSASIRSILFSKKNDFVDISKKTKEALVNIICVPKSGLFSAISGSGVIIDEKGIILTNAHIGQYFLLQDFTLKNFVTCVIRIGNPARALYTAQLFYIPPAWVSKNAEMLKSENPTGTGENDYALLLINKKIDASLLPSTFPFLEINTKDIIATGKEVLVAGYPANVFGGITLDRDLYAVSAVVEINQIQTFNGKSRDFLLLSPSSVAERGSSGGAVVDKDNNLISLIVSVKNTGTGLLGELGALSLSHINRSMLADTNMSLPSYLEQDTSKLVTNFWETKAPILIKEYSKVFSN